MKNRFFSNIPLKIIAFIAACLLWFVVVNIDDPVLERTYSGIPVSILNDTTITNEGWTYQVIDDTQNISVTVSAKRSILDKIKNTDILATADMKERSQTTIPIAITIKKYDGRYQHAISKPRNLQIKIEQEDKTNLPISVSTSGTLRSGYVLGESKADPENITIRGAKSVINSIKKVEAQVNVSGLSENKKLPAQLVIYDEKGNKIDQLHLVNNLGDKGLFVDVEVLPTKEVPVHIDKSLISAAEGYNISDVVCEPSTMRVAATSEVLEKYDDIEVPAEAVKADKLMQRTEMTVDISKFLPEDIKLADVEAKSVTVTILVDKDGTRTYELSVGSISVDNLAEGLAVSYDNVDIVEFMVRGPDNVLNSFVVNKDTGVSIDLADFKTPGRYLVPVSIKLPSGCTLDKEVMVNVTLSKAEIENQAK